MERREIYMAKVIRRLRRIDTGKIYHAVRAGSSRRRLCPQQSPRCVPVLLISDTSCSISSELEEISREEIEKIVDVLKETLEKLLCERPGPCADYRCDGHKKHGGRAAGNVDLSSNRLSGVISGTRLLYYLSSLSLEKKKAEWYREGPPNYDLFCLNTAA